MFVSFKSDLAVLVQVAVSSGNISLQVSPFHRSPVQLFDKGRGAKDNSPFWCWMLEGSHPKGLVEYLDQHVKMQILHKPNIYLTPVNSQVFLEAK